MSSTKPSSCKASLWPLAAFIWGLLALFPAQAADADAGRGAALYTSRCGACHMRDKNLVGPSLAGVFGRKAGVVPDYRYSPALRTSGLTWDAATLDKWLAGAGALVSGTYMSMKIDNPQDRADIIAYLKTLPGK